MTHSLFCFASLVSEHSDDDELYLMPGSKTSHVTGSVVSSLFHLKDQSCFVFPDLSVRTEGKWRFKMSMYEIVEDGVHFCASLFTQPFQCYSSKRFPGMSGQSSLSPAAGPGKAQAHSADFSSLPGRLSFACRIYRVVQDVRVAGPAPANSPTQQVSFAAPSHALRAPAGQTLVAALRQLRLVLYLGLPADRILFLRQTWRERRGGG